MAYANIRFDKRFKALLDALKKSPRLLKKHMRRASMLTGKQGEALVREEITSGSYVPNAPLTVALKGTDEPLKGDRPGAPLFKAITSTVIDDTTVFIGILQTNDEYNIAVTIHEGKAIQVTPAMRGMFQALWQKEKNPSLELTGRAQELWEKMPGGWKPLKKSTVVIIIPSRPFIGNVMRKGRLRYLAKKNWQGAIIAAFKEMTQQK